jgi:hypothetical protein
LADERNVLERTSSGQASEPKKSIWTVSYRFTPNN